MLIHAHEIGDKTYLNAMKRFFGSGFWLWFVGLAVVGIASFHIYLAFDAGEIQNRFLGNISYGLLSIFIAPCISFFSWMGLEGNLLFYSAILFSALVYAIGIRLMGRILDWIQNRI